MITDVLLDHRWISPTLLVLLVVIGPLAGRGLALRPTLTRWLVAVSLLPVAFLTLVPQDRRAFTRCTVEWALPTPGRVELMANLVLLIAPALLATVATRRPVRIVVAGTALSAAVEVFQAAVPGLGRSCDTNDWLSNTMGVGIGVVLGCVALRFARRSRAA